MADNNNLNDNEVKVIITADASPLKAELEKAKQDINSFANEGKGINFKTNITELKGLTEQVRKSISTGFDDGFGENSRSMKTFSKKLDDSLSNAFDSGISNGVRRGFNNAQDAFDKYIAEVKSIESVFNIKDKDLSSLAISKLNIAELEEYLLVAKEYEETFYKSFIEARQNLNSLTSDFGKVSEEIMAEYEKKVNEPNELIKEAKEAYDKYYEYLLSIFKTDAGVQRNLYDKSRKGYDINSDMREQLESYKQAWVDAEATLKETISSAFEEAQKLLNDYKTSIDEAKDKVKQLGESWNEATGKRLYAQDTLLGKKEEVKSQNYDDNLIRRLMKGVSIKAINSSGLDGMGRIAGVGIDYVTKLAGSAAKAVPYVAAILVAIKIIGAIVNSIKKATEFMKQALKTIAVTFKDMMVTGTKFLAMLSINTVKGFVTAIKGMGTALLSVVSLMAKAVTSFTKIFSMFSISYEEGIKRMYEWSLLNNGVFAKSMDTITSCFHAIENSLASIVTPLINTVAPIIDVITDKILVLTNAFAKMMAQLSGAKSYTKVTKAATKFAEANDKAAKSMEKVLLNIDELQKLTDNDSSSEIANSFSEVTTSLEELDPLKLDFDIGADFGKKVLDWLNNIDWSAIKTKAGSVGLKLANILNGIFSTEGLGRKFGDSLGEAVNTAFAFLKNFIDTINVKQIANQIAEVVNGFFDTTQWKDHGQTIGKYIQAAFDFVYEFLTTLDTAKIGQAISDLINGIWEIIDGEKIGLTLSEVVNTAFDILDNHIKTLDIQEIVTDISNLITSFFSNINFDQIDVTLSDLVKSIVTAINTFLNDEDRVNAVANAIYRLVKAAIDTAFGLITGIDWTKLAQNIGKYMSDAIKGLDPEKIVKSIMTVFNAAFQLIINTPWKEIAKFGMDLFNEILTAIPQELAKVSPAEIGKRITEILNIIIDDMNPSNISAAINAMIDWVAELWDAVKNGVKWKELVDKICEAIAKVDWAQAFKIVWEVWWKCWTYKNMFKFEIMFNLVADLVKDFKEKISDKIQEITGIGEGIAKAIVEGIEAILFATNPFTSIFYWANKVKDVIADIKSDINNIDVDEYSYNGSGGGGRHFASGGVVYGPTAAIVGEYAGASTNPEIITPENKMREIFAEGNSELANVYIQVGRQIVQAIQDQDFNVSIGDDLIARAAARGNNNYRRMTGAALI